MCDLQDQRKIVVRILRRRTVYEVFHNLSYNKAMKNEEYNETSICYLLSSFFNFRIYRHDTASRSLTIDSNIKTTKEILLKNTMIFLFQF